MRPSRPCRLPACPLLLGLLVLAACQGQAPDGAAPTAEAPDAATAQAHVALEDVVESGEGYLVGISYPRSIEAHPGLAKALKAYADDARADLRQALAMPEADGGDPTVPGPYDLSLAFTALPGTPDVVAVAADGSSYLGGAHGQPLVRRWVWLPAERRMLTAEALIPDPAGWEAVSEYVRERLFEQLSLRLADEGIAPEDRAEWLRTEGAMIEAGTEPSPGHFDQFEPVPGAGGKLAGLRFVFPPYQVGPYAAGTHSVDVPARVLLPHVAPAYRDLFATR